MNGLSNTLAVVTERVEGANCMTPHGDGHRSLDESPGLRRMWMGGEVVMAVLDYDGYRYETLVIEYVCADYSGEAWKSSTISKSNHQFYRKR